MMFSLAFHKVLCLSFGELMFHDFQPFSFTLRWTRWMLWYMWWLVLINNITFHGLQFDELGYGKLCLLLFALRVSGKSIKASDTSCPLSCLSLSHLVLVQSAWKLHLWHTVTWCRMCSITPLVYWTDITDTHTLTYRFTPGYSYLMMNQKKKSNLQTVCYISAHRWFS